jgi:hypothetical protein
MDSRVNTFQGLIDSLSSLSTPIENTTAALLTYLSARTPFLKSSLSDLPSTATSSYLLNGNSCSIVSHLLTGVYNEFCLNLRAISNEIYLLVICNICYLIAMVIFSLLYAVELRNLSEKELEESYHNTQFLQTNNHLSSESHSELSLSEQKSTQSHESGSGSGDGGG